MCKKCGLPSNVNLASLTAIRQKALQEVRYNTFKNAVAECLLAKARYEAADRAYSARGETDSTEASEYRDALDLYKINTLLLAHAAQAYEKGGAS